MSEEEKLFPSELRVRGIRSPGSEWGWKLDDVPRVVEECQKLGYGIIGGQIQFIFPDATCEPYWLSADPKEKTPEESWSDYSKRSCFEFLDLFNELVAKTDFEKEGLKWPFIKDKKESLTNILEYLYFIVYPISETEYQRLFGSR